MILSAWMEGLGGWWDGLGAAGAEGGLGWMSSSEAKRTPFVVVGGLGALVMPLLVGWVRGSESFWS